LDRIIYGPFFLSLYSRFEKILIINRMQAYEIWLFKHVVSIEIRECSWI